MGGGLTFLFMRRPRYPISIESRAIVTLAPLFQDHAVLQCDTPLPIWGHAAAGERVTVMFKGQRVSTVTDGVGHWEVFLDGVPASAEPAELVATGGNTVTVRDVLVGEVWLASGQSNMARPLSDARNAESEIAAANFPLLRRFNVQNTVADRPATTVPGRWQVCEPQVAGGFSGVGYFFARDLHRKLGVPVGLIQSTWGGTPIEAWISDAALRSTSVFSKIDARWHRDCAEYAERKVLYPAEQAAWGRADEHSKATRTHNMMPWPKVPAGPGTQDALSGLYNGMIAPLQPGALRGIIWWQGESNWMRVSEYAELFQTMIRSWRAAWRRDNLPFYFVQLANYKLGCDSTDRAWAQLREAQAQALTLSSTAMAVTIDLGDPFEMHLSNKQEIGRRLALIAQTQVYGIPEEWSGPVFAFAEREGAAMRVHFTHATPVLVARRTPLPSFELAGMDRVFHPATARIERDTLLVASTHVPAPVAVRYAWSNAPEAGLYNRASLPAASFRSDSGRQRNT
ncbi:MAG: sialate O-acetylesterase [Verrucomicrobia bacterium]|nr:sialate O-acetylesterase [Verrucomicrobiota bacterium]